MALSTEFGGESFLLKAAELSEKNNLSSLSDSFWLNFPNISGCLSTHCAGNSFPSLDRFSRRGSWFVDNCLHHLVVQEAANRCYAWWQSKYFNHSRDLQNHKKSNLSWYDPYFAWFCFFVWNALNIFYPPTVYGNGRFDLDPFWGKKFGIYFWEQVHNIQRVG